MAEPKILIAYFSHSGNTRTVAAQIQKMTGGALHEIKTVEPYPQDYDSVVKAARAELQADARPTLSGNLPEVSACTDIYLGYPNWWGTIPMALFSFLEALDLSGKTIHPFCTHEGSGLGRSVADIQKLCKRSIVGAGLAVKGGSARSAEKNLRGWIC